MNVISEAVNTANNDIQLLAIASVKMQESDFEDLYSCDEALVRGTVFPKLYLPFYGEGEGRR